MHDRGIERETVAVYEREAHEFRRRRPPSRTARAEAFALRVPIGAVRADLGCGPGNYCGVLGDPVVAMDAAKAMLDLVGDTAPSALRVQADLEWLPFRDGAIGAAWASMSYLHVPSERLPLALAHLHRALRVGAPVHVDLMEGEGEGPYPGDDFPGRFFALWSESRLRDVLTGAGFSVLEVDQESGSFYVQATRDQTLTDTVAAQMQVLVCGLNPSIYAADAGVGYARPGNRFWPAAIAAGLVTRSHDAFDALASHGVGMTDLCKRATARSSELTAEEYGEGAARVERLVEWLSPKVICFVGLEGWRSAVDARATAGIQERTFGGARAYVMPSTSGVNGHASLEALTAHFTAVRELATS